MTKLLSDKIKVTPPTEVSAGRYEFLRLNEAEPNLGIANGPDYILTTDTTGARVWKNPSTISGTVGFTGSTGDLGFTGSKGDIGFTGSRGVNVIAGSSWTTYYSATPTISSSAYATKGNIFTTSKQTILTSVTVYFGAVAQTVKFGIAQLSNVNPGLVTSIVYESNSVVWPAAAGYCTFSIPEGLTLSNNSIYAFYITRTDGTATAPLSIDFPGTTAGGDPSGTFVYNGGIRLADNNITAGESLFYANNALVVMTIETVDDTSLGLISARGFTGSIGQIGFAGSAGAAGEVGFTGSAGTAGEVGFTGSAGAGFTGSTGTTGFTGSRGSTGFTGSVGFTGSAGSVGFTGSRGTDGTVSWITKTANYTAVKNNAIIADTTSGTFTITLPASPQLGDGILLADGYDWSINSLIVARNGSTIEGLAEDFTLDVPGIQVEFIYNGTTWQIYARVGQRGLPGPNNIPSAGTEKTTSYTLTTNDVGDHVVVGSGGAITVPNNTFAAGDIVTIYNNTAGSITITLSTTNAYISGVNTNKTSVSLLTRGIASILFISSTLCIVTGSVV